ncbi:MAG: ribonuclease Z [Pseudomonadota bacterium]
MHCFVLGTGGMMPMPYRWLTSVAIRTGGQIYLFDCGEGNQVPYKELHLGLRPLRIIAISHLHADHILGLPGILMLRAQMPDPEPLLLLGPPGLERFIRNVRQDVPMHINYPIEVREWSKQASALAYEDELVRLFWHPLEHSLFCLGYRLEEHERPGKFDLDAAQKLGIPAGPLFGQLQAGNSVTLPNGEVVTPKQVLGPNRRGRCVAFATDTVFTPQLYPLLKDTDLAFVESMYLSEHEEDAAEKKHMTATQAAQAAQNANVQQLLLIHLSPRYEKKDRHLFTKEAQAVHNNARAARDGEMIEVPLP